MLSRLICSLLSLPARGRRLRQRNACSPWPVWRPALLQELRQRTRGSTLRAAAPLTLCPCLLPTAANIVQYYGAYVGEDDILAVCEFMEVSLQTLYIGAPMVVVAQRAQHASLGRALPASLCLHATQASCD